MLPVDGELSGFGAGDAGGAADDGGYANQDEVPVGLTPPTAAAATLLRHLRQPIDPALREWLLSRHLAV